MSIPFAKSPTAAIIDMHSVLHTIKEGVRANTLYNSVSAGRTNDTTIISRFFYSLQSYADVFNTTKFTFAWDSPVSLRKQIYSGYKDRNKKELTEAESQFNSQAMWQFRVLRDEIIPALGFTRNYICEGYEADDIIASIVLRDKGKYTIVSEDADLYQLLDYADIYRHRHKTFYTKTHFICDYGIEPIIWKDVKAIAGCKTDTVPGIPRVGETTAINYLTHKLSPKTKTFQAITNPENAEIIERARKLTSLPMSMLTFPEATDSPVDEDTVYEIGVKYNIYALQYDKYVMQMLSHRRTK